MSKTYKVFLKILYGSNFHNIRFDELRGLLNHIGFTERVKGSHYIFTRSDVEEIINIQPIGSFAKPYQVKQIQQIIIKYNLQRIFDD